ncbi:MAG: ComEA family DNA-binding protein [Pirellulaceae bacterium]
MNTPNRSRTQDRTTDARLAQSNGAFIAQIRDSTTKHEYTATAGWLSFSAAILTLVTVLSIGRLVVDWAQASSLPRDATAISSPDLQFQIDVNSATSAQLQALPDIGPTLAQRIVSTRDKLGRFETPEDLLAVHGFGPATLQGLKEMLDFEAPTKTRANDESSFGAPAGEYSAASRQASSR